MTLFAVTVYGKSVNYACSLMYLIGTSILLQIPNVQHGGVYLVTIDTEFCDVIAPCLFEGHTRHLAFVHLRVALQ